MNARRLSEGLALSLTFAAFVWTMAPVNLSATHAWADYHWARTANPFTLKLYRHLTATWDPYLDLASAAWTTASKLNTTIVEGLSDAATRQACPMVAGRTVVCNYSYGQLGWSGIATIWFDSNHHIVQATTKMNDSYGWSPGGRQLVMCQEVGHTFGLNHQDEKFGNPNLGSCMDYTSHAFGPPNNLALNQHDHDELNLIYTHLDNYTTLTAPSVPVPDFGRIDFNQPVEWGTLKASFNGGRTEIYERQLGDGYGAVTFVIWAEEEMARRRR